MREFPAPLISKLLKNHGAFFKFYPLTSKPRCSAMWWTMTIGKMPFLPNNVFSRSLLWFGPTCLTNCWRNCKPYFTPTLSQVDKFWLLWLFTSCRKQESWETFSLHWNPFKTAVMKFAMTIVPTGWPALVVRWLFRAVLINISPDKHHLTLYSQLHLSAELQHPLPP